MRFGGHESFHIREGWLYKGVNLIATSKENFTSTTVADELGVGKNMAKSIRHWLILSGLAETTQVDGSASRPLSLTPLGRVVKEHDPDFLLEGTWWLLHANILNQPKEALVWQWMFNHLGMKNFERGVGFDHLTRFLGTRGIPKLPSIETLHRDYSCLLNSYSRALPAAETDPEEALECPFSELGLLTFHRNTGRYVVQSGARRIHPAIFGYVMEHAFARSFGKNAIKVPLEDVISKPGAPGRVFLLSADALFDILSRYEDLPKRWFEVTGLAGMRELHVKRFSLTQWAEFYYQQPDLEVQE